jgi:hypothetical protein
MRITRGAIGSDRMLCRTHPNLLSNAFGPTPVHLQQFSAHLTDLFKVKVVTLHNLFIAALVTGYYI